MQVAYNYSNPLLIINFAGEIVYILDQRLRAQKIEADKQDRVLTDVIRFIFNYKKTSEFFEVKETLPLKKLQEFIEQAVLCSIMKLNDSSMRKLLDLAFMGVKMQIYNTQSPSDIFYITLNHLNGILEIIKNSVMSANLIELRKQFIQIYSEFSLIQYIQFKQQLMQILQAKQVRVYMFIQEKYQNPDGTFVVQNLAEFPAPNVGMPGRVWQYENGQKQVQKKKLFVLKAAAGFKKNKKDQYFQKQYITEYQLGRNMYFDYKSSSSKGKTSGQPERQVFKNDEEMKKILKVDFQQGKSQINNLATLIKGAPSAEAKEDQKEDGFSINIFSNTKNHPTVKGQKQAEDDLFILDDKEDSLVDMIMIQTDKEQQGKQSINKKIVDLFGDNDNEQQKNKDAIYKKQQKDDKSSKQNNDDNDDNLLDMMDKL